jgi:hypothetical protein
MIMVISALEMLEERVIRFNWGRVKAMKRCDGTIEDGG